MSSCTASSSVKPRDRQLAYLMRYCWNTLGGCLKWIMAPSIVSILVLLRMREPRSEWVASLDIKRGREKTFWTTTNKTVGTLLEVV
ncbi:hypothetical protein B0H12DRAFT_589871 [Mycena haematopus]|nr:hypothetical protein B0H12DRAFT_589871 [Mycena haematopus]